MATRSCPQCGSQYVASVRRCITCDVVLQDDVPPAVPGGAQGEEPGLVVGEMLGRGDQIAYELDSWGNQLKVSLEGMLDHAGVRRVWEAGTLVVPAEYEEEVDALIAALEGRDVGDLSDVEEQVAFEIEDLDAGTASDLDAMLIASGIAHSWSDEGDLLVSLEDESVAADLIDRLLSSALDDEGPGVSDGLAANEALSDLYLVLDRLVPDPHDAKLASQLAEVVKVIGALGVPYGFSSSDWDALGEDLEALVGLVAVDPSTVDGDPDDEQGGPAPDRVTLAESGDGDRSDADDADVPTWPQQISRPAAGLRQLVQGGV